MPYKSISELPDKIRKVLPEAGQRTFLKAFNSSYARTENDATASRVAWDIVKKRFRRAGTQWVAMSADFEPPELFTFQIESSPQQIIVNAFNDDEIEIEGVLASTTPRKGDGKWFTEESLEALAEQINSNGSTLPDVEHAVMAALRDQFVPADRLPRKVMEEKGMFNRIKAAVRDGKLWIKAWLDARYKEIINLYKFLSIEALAKPQDDGSLIDPMYLGFTFTENPRIPDASLAGI